MLVVLGKCLLIGSIPARCQAFQFLLAQPPGLFGSDRQTTSQQRKNNNHPSNYTLLSSLVKKWPHLFFVVHFELY